MFNIRKFASRDVDSWILPRERDAVNDWEERGMRVRNSSYISKSLNELLFAKNAGTQFHVMRDGPFHHTPILAGLWGADNYRNFSRALEVRRRLLEVKPNQWKFFDQKILATRVWPVIR